MSVKFVALCGAANHGCSRLSAGSLHSCAPSVSAARYGLYNVVGRMLTKDLRFLTHIKGSPDTIFDLVADMPNYGRWLPDSSAFGGTVDVTPYPVRLGTTYVDAGPIQKPGSVTEYDRPKHISFHHTVQLRRTFLNSDIDAQIRYTFDPENGGTSVDRRLVLTFNLTGVSYLLLPILIYGFRKENNRTLAALKRYVEARGK